MTYENPVERQPKGDHNRRISLGFDPDAFAAEAGVTTEQLREYERTSPDHRFDPEVAARIGATLDRLESVLPNSQTGRDEPAPDASAVAASERQVPPAGPNGPRYTAEADENGDMPGADGRLSARANQDTYD